MPHGDIQTATHTHKYTHTHKHTHTYKHTHTHTHTHTQTHTLAQNTHALAQSHTRTNTYTNIFDGEMELAFDRTHMHMNKRIHTYPLAVVKAQKSQLRECAEMFQAQIGNALVTRHGKRTSFYKKTNNE